MIVFALTVFFCISATSCRWYSLAYFVSEEKCKEAGKEVLEDDKQILVFRCTVELTQELNIKH